MVQQYIYAPALIIYVPYHQLVSQQSSRTLHTLAYVMCVCVCTSGLPRLFSRPRRASREDRPRPLTMKVLGPTQGYDESDEITRGLVASSIPLPLPSCLEEGRR